MSAGFPVIDAHQHFWRIGRNGCVWPPPALGSIHRDFLPADLVAAAEGIALAGSVAVQSQPCDADTDWLCDLARAEARILGVVGWVDLEAADAPARIALLAARPKFRGLRPMLQSLPADDWIAEAPLSPAIEAMLAHGLAFDALVHTRHLPHLARFARRWPTLPIVIDHAAKPPIASGALEPWKSAVADLADCPNVVCKLSGLLTEAEPGQPAAALAPYVSWLLDAFGPARLMWGSDWPVLLLAGDYPGWFASARDLSGLTGGALLRLFAGTARDFYRL